MSPLTANVAGVNNAVGNTPGVGVIRVEQDGKMGCFRPSLLSLIL